MAGESVVSMAVEAIENLLIEEGDGKFLHGVKDQARELQAELKRMQCFLRDADKRTIEDDLLGQRVFQAKNIACAAEDLLESYAFKVRYRSEGGPVKVLKRCACILYECYIRHKVEFEIQALKEKVVHLNNCFEEYGVTSTMEEESSSSRQQQHRRTYSFLEEENNVGFNGLERDVEVEQIVKLLVSEDGPRFVTICGMDGLGKTTLARKVYNHPDVKRYFAGFAWICVTQKWDAEDILRRIIIQFVPERKKEIEENWNKGVLVRLLLDIQNQKRCLIVLDDIWTTDAQKWRKFEILRGIKTLLTTRFEDVASGIGDFCHLLKPFSAKESWELLLRKALRARNVTGAFEDLGRRMVDCCGGLPLALVVLGGILSTKNTLKEWETVYRNINSYYSHDNNYRGDLFWILSLGYNDLPAPLKQCFLYLGSFPEDTDIKSETLYHLWIAEGLVSMLDLDREESMMELAENYLGELAARGMVQLQTSNVPMIRRFESCRLHSLIRDLCLFKAKEERFFHYIQDYPFERDMDRPLRRLVINTREYFPLGKEVYKNVRMLRFIDQVPFDGCMEKIIEFQVKNLKMLRVLSIEGLRPVDMWKLPKAIGELIHLRYLSLKDSSVVTLPSSLTNLKHLQTLDLRVFKLGRLPNILWKMVGLTYLYLPNLYKLNHQANKIRLHDLSKLEILENFSDQMCDVHDLPKLTNLQVLVAHCLELENLATVANYASNNRRLQHVSILTDCEFNMEKGFTVLQQSLFGSKIHCFHSEGAIRKFPEYESPISSSLVQLSMNLLGLKGDNVLGTLEKLVNLRILFLWRFEGIEMIFHAGGFPQLKILRLFSFLNLKKWVVGKTAMPNLCTLSIWGFTALEMLPDGLQFITTLGELDVRNMSQKFQARVWAQDGKKISHVPLVLANLPAFPHKRPTYESTKFLLEFLQKQKMKRRLPRRRRQRKVTIFKSEMESVTVPSSVDLSHLS